MAQDKIKIPSKSFAVNSWKVYPYVMDINMKVTASNYAHEVIKKIIEGPPLQSLVINCHGSPAYLDIGSDGLNWDNLNLWKHLKENKSPQVKTIYMVSCNIVSFGHKRDGNLFCGAVAKFSGAYVIASSKTQRPSACDKGYVDDFEGPVWIWNPKGSNSPWDHKPKSR